MGDSDVHDEHDRRQRASDARRRARRRRKLDDVFGEAVPDLTRDEAADSGPRSTPRRPADDRDDEIRREVPPHHA
jgi:hypothetical protein